MGYRLYLGKITKEEHDKMQKMSLPYLCEKYGDKGDDFVSVYKLVAELHGFGKYYEVDTSKCNPFFANKEIQSHFEGDFWIVDKDFLLGIIEKERLAVVEWYKELKEKPHEILIDQADRELREWEGKYGKPYNLDLDKEFLVNSWHRNYTIFDLVRIYKTFDFEKDLLVYYGW